MKTVEDIHSVREQFGNSIEVCSPHIAAHILNVRAPLKAALSLRPSATKSKRAFLEHIW
jgi:hypothetical protein